MRGVGVFGYFREFRWLKVGEGVGSVDIFRMVWVRSMVVWLVGELVVLGREEGSFWGWEKVERRIR